MSNTAPVVIQDKNGKTTTVHRRNDADTAIINSKLPSPQLTGHRTKVITNKGLIALMEDRTPLTHNPNKKFRFKSVFTGASAQQVDDSLDFILEEDPELGLYAEKLMTTGSVAAKEMAKEYFSETINSIAAAIDHRETDPDWDRTTPYSEEIKSEMLRAWNIGNVADECGIHYDRKTLKGAATLSEFINRRWKFLAEAEGHAIDDPEVYWRGIAALVLSDSIEDFTSTLPEHGPEFVAWAGYRSDLSGVLQIVKERKTVNPATIEGLLAEKGIEPSLRDGIL